MISEGDFDFIQWRPGRSALYESNYLKANSPDGRRGLWLKHNILAPKDPDRPAVLELWCVLFDRDAGSPRAVKQTRPMSEVAVGRDSLRIQADDVLLTPEQTRTSLVDPQGATASWDIALTSLAAPLFHLPFRRLYTSSFPKKKLITPAPRLLFEGHLDFEGDRVDVDGWIGIRGHNWGSEHAWSYAYGNCNLFREDQAVILDMFTAKIRFGPLMSPWISAGILRERRREHRFNRLREALVRGATVAFPRWQATLRREDRELVTNWELDPEQCIGLRYLHPDGKLSFCYNTKFAEVSARLDGREFTSDQAELEILVPEPIEGIALYGEDHLPARGR